MVWGEVLWAGLLATMYVVIVSAVLVVIQWAGLLALDLRWLPVLWPITFVAGCGFAALGLCFTAIVPTIDHMNLPVFLLVLPMGLLSSTYFPLEHPVLVALNAGNPLYHLAQAFRGILIGGPVAGHLAGVVGLSALMLGDPGAARPAPAAPARARRLGYGLSTRSGGPSGRTNAARIRSKRLTISLRSCRRPISRFISPPRPATWSVETRLLERISTPSS